MSDNFNSPVLTPCIALLLIIASGCSHIGEKSGLDQSATVDRVWPEKPAKARVAYVKSFASAADLDMSPGFFARILDFITGKSDRHLVRPMAVLETADGKIYVADPGSRAVHRFDTRNGKHSLVGADTGQAFLSPIGLAIGASDEIYITDSFLGKVYVLQPGSEKAQILELETPPEQPTNIVVHSQSQRIYIVDAARHQIMVYGSDGSLLNIIGQRGEADGEFNFPSMIWLDHEDRLLVSDALNFRIQIFDLEGRFLTKFGQHGDGSGDMARPKGVATDRHGHIYVVDALFHSLQLFNDSGEFLLNIGRHGNAVGEFLLPTGIYINAENLIYVADSHNSRIQVFRYIGDQP